MTPLNIPQELQEGSVLVVAHTPSCLAVHVKVVHGLFSGIGYLIETQEGNFAVVSGWAGYTAKVKLFPAGTTMEEAIALYN